MKHDRRLKHSLLWLETTIQRAEPWMKPAGFRQVSVITMDDVHYKTLKCAGRFDRDYVSRTRRCRMTVRTCSINALAAIRLLRRLPRHRHLPTRSRRPIGARCGRWRNGRCDPKAVRAWFGHHCGLPCGQGSKHGTMKPSTEVRMHDRLHWWRNTPVRLLQSKPVLLNACDDPDYRQQRLLF